MLCSRKRWVNIQSHVPVPPTLPVKRCFQLNVRIYIPSRSKSGAELCWLLLWLWLRASCSPTQVFHTCQFSLLLNIPQLFSVLVSSQSSRTQITHFLTTIFPLFINPFPYFANILKSVKSRSNLDRNAVSLVSSVRVHGDPGCAQLLELPPACSNSISPNCCTQYVLTIGRGKQLKAEVFYSKF